VRKRTKESENKTYSAIIGVWQFGTTGDLTELRETIKKTIPRADGKIMAMAILWLIKISN
jgi:hypothetical protein